jgi:hypothetical protein
MRLYVKEVCTSMTLKYGESGENLTSYFINRAFKE